MQKQQSSKGTYIALIVIVIVSIGLYFYFKGDPASEVDGVSSFENPAPLSSEAAVLGGRVLNLLAQINSLKIDETLFDSVAYKSLVDYTITVPPQPVGRPNPFAPFAGSVPPASSIRLPGTAR